MAIDGTPGPNDMPGRIVFSTTPDGTGNPVERLRITESGNVGIGTASPDASALLDVSSTTRGLLPPRMTGAQVSAIAAPANGLLVYNTTTGRYNAYQGGAWQEILTSASGNIADDQLDFDKFKDAMTLDASTDIAASGTNVLSITNTGTGNSFVVNDEAADTSPFVIDASGNIGIGTSSPQGILDVQKDGATVYVRDGDSATRYAAIAIQTAGGAWHIANGLNNSGATNNNFNIFRGTDLTDPYMTITRDTRAVGIGTASPAEKLDLGGGNIKMGYTQISNSCPSTADCVVTCPSGKYVTGGGCWLTSTWAPMQHEPLGNNAWHCMSNGSAVRVTAICANIR